MKKIGIAFMAVFALASFSGCKKKGGDAMAKMGEFKDHMCACKDGDKDCAMKVQKEMADYAEANKDMKDQKMSDEDMKKATEIGMEMAKCSAKAMGAPAMGGAPAAPAGDKPADKPAEGAAPAGDKPAGDKPAEGAAPAGDKPADKK
jgi:hypothetical protein